MVKVGLNGTGNVRAERTGVGQILIVEDDAGIRAVLAEALTDEGYTVTQAEHGAHALALLNGSETVQPQLILLDDRMPVMDGAAFVRAYRERPGPHVPVVAVTGSTAPLGESLHEAATAVLEKPFELDDLFALVAGLLPRAQLPQMA